MLKHIIILVLLLTAFENIFCQLHITGKVIDKKDGSPIAFAAVLVKETKIETNTHEDGTFSLNVPDSNSVIVIAYVGYKEQTIFLKGQTYFEVKLKPVCNRDWFDNRQITINLNSGIIHNPIGARIVFFITGLLQTNNSYNFFLLSNKSC